MNSSTKKLIRFTIPSYQKYYVLLLDQNDYEKYSYNDVLNFLQTRFKQDQIFIAQENLKIAHKNTKLDSKHWEVLKKEKVLGDFIVCITPIKCKSHTQHREYRIFH